MKKTKELLVVLAIIFSVVCFSKVNIFSNNVLAETRTENGENNNSDSYVGYYTLDYGFYEGETRRLVGPQRVLLLSSNQNTGKYYYNQLKSDLSRTIYNALLEADPTNTGKVEINVTGYEFVVSAEEYEDLAGTSGTLFANNFADDICDAIEAFDSDNPAKYWYFYPRSGYYSASMQKDGQYIVYFHKFTVEPVITQQSDYETFNTKVNQVVETIDGESTYDKLKQIHDYICSNVTYANNIGTSKKEHTAYSALVEESAVCDGQAKLFKLLCDKKGIPCLYITGNAITSDNQTEGHAWNYVYIEEEEKWYAIDVTWDNQKLWNHETVYNYFLVGSNTIVFDDVTFSTNHLPGLKHFEEQSYIPEVPTLSTTAYETFQVQRNINPASGDTSSVTVTLVANRELKPIDGWTLSNGGKTMTKTYTQNVTEDFYVYNTRNEKKRLNFTINNIVEGEVFTPSVRYSTKSQTASGVTVEITSNKALKPLTGWTLSQDNKTLSKVFFENTTQDVTVTATDNSTATVQVSIGNIIAQQCGVSYNPAGITNQNVTATITSNFDMIPVTGWSLSQDKRSMTKVFTQNGSETVTITNFDGRTTTVNVAVAGIDKVAPVLQYSYNPTQETTGTVTYTVTSNEIMKSVSGWSLSNDGLTLTKIYSENTTETVTFSDLAGNTVEKNIVIDNILSGSFACTVSFDNNSPTNGSVVATITGNRNLAELDGWTLSGRTLTKTFNENTNQTITVTSQSGEQFNIPVIITNIDKTSPTLNVAYDTTEETISSVVATITANEAITNLPSGWEYTDATHKSISKTFIDNGTEAVTVKDLAGNTASVNVSITNILEKPVYTVQYSKTGKTNEDVTVTINSTLEIQPVEGWTLSNDKKSLSKTFSSNYSGNVTVLSALGHTNTVAIGVDNIDKVDPELEVQYSDVDDNGKITVTIKSNEQLQEKTGWTLSEDKLSLSKVFSANVTDEVIVTDLAGNTRKISIEVTKLNPNQNDEVTEIDTIPNETATENKSGNVDDSAAKGKLSDTGAFHNVLIAAIAVFGLTGVVGYKKYKKLYK